MAYRVSVAKLAPKIVDSFDLALDEIAKSIYIDMAKLDKAYHLKQIEKCGITWFAYGFTTATITLIQE